MRKLVERNWNVQPAKGPISFSPYQIGQQCSIMSNSGFYQLMTEYYSGDNAIIVERDLQKATYVIEPIGSDDRLTVSHWDLWPLNFFEESRALIPLGLAQPGTMIKLLDNGVLKLVKGPYGKGKMLFADDEVTSSRRLVQIMLPIGQKHLAESLVRY